MQAHNFGDLTDYIYTAFRGPISTKLLSIWNLHNFFISTQLTVCWPNHLIPIRILISTLLPKFTNLKYVFCSLKPSKIVWPSKINFQAVMRSKLVTEFIFDFVLKFVWLVRSKIDHSILELPFLYRFLPKMIISTLFIKVFQMLYKIRIFKIYLHLFRLGFDLAKIYVKLNIMSPYSYWKDSCINLNVGFSTFNWERHSSSFWRLCYSVSLNDYSFNLKLSENSLSFIPASTDLSSI